MVFILTVSSKDDVTAAFVSPVALILARTGAPKPIEESCRLVNNTICLNSFKMNKYHLTGNSYGKIFLRLYLSEIVLSRSTNAPPQMKRMSFVSICRLFTSI